MQQLSVMEILPYVAVIAGPILFVFLLILFIFKSTKTRNQEREAKRAKAFLEGYTGRARVVDLRQAGAQRSDEFVLFKVLLEVFPDNSEPSFSATVVWEIAPLMVDSLQIGSILPVKINPDDLRQVFPTTTGMKYSHTYQFAYLGIENDFEPRRVIAAQDLSPAAPRAKTVYRKRSKISLFGMPLWEIAMNLSTAKYARRAKARAVIAIGDSASGLIAVGQIARGAVAIGHVAFGLFSVGGLSFGIVSFGLNSIGLVSFGAVSLALLAAGGVGFGFICASLLSFGVHVLGRDFQLPLLSHLFENFKRLIGLNYTPFDFVFIIGAAGFAIFMSALIGRAVLGKMLSPNDNSLEPRR